MGSVELLKLARPRRVFVLRDEMVVLAKLICVSCISTKTV